jgi:hypothetical protein
MCDASAVLSRRRFFLLAGAAARLKASDRDFWNRKPAAEWSTGDIYRLANHSPWADPVQAWARSFSGRGVASAGGIVWPSSPEFGPKGVVTWESARPMREALKTALPRGLASLYVIGVDGIPLGGSRNLYLLRQFTALRGKGKAKWIARPSAVRELVRNSVVYAFGFPKSSVPIDADTAEVDFETQFGRWWIQAKFKPKDMLYHGQLAL